MSRSQCNDNFKLRVGFISAPSTAPYLDEFFLKNKYLNENLSAKELAKLAGCSKSTIIKYLENYGIDKRSRGKQIKKATCRYGLKYSEGVEVNHVREQQIINYIKKLNRSGLSNEEITKKLNNKNIPTKTNKGGMSKV